MRSLACSYASSPKMSAPGLQGCQLLEDIAVINFMINYKRKLMFMELVQLVSIEKIWYFRQLIPSTCILNCILDPQREYQITQRRGTTTIEKICILETHIISGCSYVAGGVRCIRTNQHWRILAGGIEAHEGLSVGGWRALVQINMRWIDLITNHMR
jgi:hypothetical protein